MKEEEKLRQRDRETAATLSCSPTQPLPVVPPVKEETHSPEVSPPPQKRLERPEQCRAFPTSVICRPRSSRDEERPEPQGALSPGAAYPPPQSPHGLPLNLDRDAASAVSHFQPISAEPKKLPTSRAAPKTRSRPQPPSLCPAPPPCTSKPTLPPEPLQPTHGWAFAVPASPPAPLPPSVEGRSPSGGCQGVTEPPGVAKGNVPTTSNADAGPTLCASPTDFASLPRHASPRPNQHLSDSATQRT